MEVFQVKLNWILVSYAAQLRLRSFYIKGNMHTPNKQISTLQCSPGMHGKRNFCAFIKYLESIMTYTWR